MIRKSCVAFLKQLFNMPLTQAQQPYLVGIKGVAQTALAQCLQDKGQTVRGCDVAEDFVTAEILEQRNIQIDLGFDHLLPTETDYVVYTSAHNAQENPVVKDALSKNLPTVSHAEALAELFNEKKGIAVCGVGGKSTTSALLAWIFEQTNQNASYAVGVGNILSLQKTGFWSEHSAYFVAEADEYVTDPSAPSRGEAITPRFSFLKPYITICTNLQFDHPDVYRDFTHTRDVFLRFFQNIQPGGTLIYNADDSNLKEVIKTLHSTRPDIQVLSFGHSEDATLQIKKLLFSAGLSTAETYFNGEPLTLSMKLPGEYNLANAAAAFLAAQATGIENTAITGAIATFSSTLRRSQYVGTLQEALCYDDYAHHPSEIQRVITGLKQWYPDKKLVVAFQPHTFSRTQALLKEFAVSLTNADHIILLKIFASAREKDTHTVSNQNLIEEITQLNTHTAIISCENLEELAQELSKQATSDTVIVTLGAGDIYQVYDKLALHHD